MNTILKKYFTQVQPLRFQSRAVVALVCFWIFASGISTVTSFAGDYPDRILYDAQQDHDISSYRTLRPEEGDLENGRSWGIWEGSEAMLDRPFSAFDLYFSDVAFIGSIVGYEKRCFIPPRGFTESIVVIRFCVESSYWGVRYPEIVVDAQTNQGQNCVFYTPPPFSEFAIGDKFLFLGLIDGGRTSAFNIRGLLRVTKDAFVSAHGWRLPLEETKELLLTASQCRSYESQAQESELICVVTLTADGLEHGSKSVAVSTDTVYKGQPQDSILHIAWENNQNSKSPCDYAISSNSSFHAGSRYLVFLKEGEPGYYKLLHGWHSMLAIEGGCLFTRGEGYVSSYSDMTSLLDRALRD